MNQIHSSLISKIQEKIEAANQEKIQILAFYYLFKNIQNNNRNLEEEQNFFKEICVNLFIKGTILVSNEGINGTVSGFENKIEEFLEILKQKLKSYEMSSDDDTFEFKFSSNDFLPFSKLKILLREEVVALKSDLDQMDFSLKPTNADSETWNSLLDSKDVQLIDTRNDYEFNLGTFKGAINPNIKNFREFKDFLRKSIEDGSLDKKKPCAIFCTGGIRCEKAGIYMKNLGFEEVFQLKGGILKYFEETKNDLKKWIGDCFVFDDRITVNEKLEKGELRCIHCHEKIETIEEKRSVTKARIVCKNCSSKLNLSSS
jgi:UPF0176 protein